MFTTWARIWRAYATASTRRRGRYLAEIGSRLERKDLDPLGHAGHAEAVPAARPDHARHERAVLIGVVGDPAIPVAEVEAVYVVDPAVAVVIHTRAAGRLCGVDEEIRNELWVARVDTGVDDSDDDRVAPYRGVPGLRGVDVGVGRPGHQCPLARVDRSGPCCLGPTAP